jgi:hypothetical protein
MDEVGRSLRALPVVCGAHLLDVGITGGSRSGGQRKGTDRLQGPDGVLDEQHQGLVGVGTVRSR